MQPLTKYTLKEIQTLTSTITKSNVKASIMRLESLLLSDPSVVMPARTLERIVDRACAKARTDNDLSPLRDVVPFLGRLSVAPEGSLSQIINAFHKYIELISVLF